MNHSGRTIGVLGGGQLARMLALAGAPLGLRFLVVDSAEDACAAQVAPMLRADWRDFDALADFARRIDVATFDFENVPADTAHWLTEHTKVFPNPRALATSQDRLAEKSLFREIGLDTPAFAAVDSRDDLARAVETIGTPSILKTRRLGYDGKGQFRLKSVADVDAAWEALGGAPSILEAFVPFERELSVVAVRARDGEFRTWPLTQNWHADGILSASLAPAPHAETLAPIAFAHARRIAEALDYVGTFALELFVRDGRLLGNEMAPRVHNSGHWTIEGSPASQFENHVRAVLGMPLGDTSALGINAMLNWVGELPPADPVLAEPRAHWHDYGKSPRAGRKVGHATFCADDAAEMRDRLRRIGAALGREAQVAPVIAALG
ncbi:5-(carboxyamino)imidazole ribonucleotide synthase [Dokdonella fugitiva]|jgi:5-(carboxyamino)imidazole ribonucleotide synthase|uniref:N5-carboxyaminoimidazole ribonucleotide synthase n=1 Tax=Dokdonella fugitiva TaxID=328517 RepID=A0A4R2ID24_9GAMM|nr:5-(carboxyamino)imidazole ribonucleotide synthase [Dokdonella fugitiva]MBA8884953.1 5-(carboxyamino)imidazole ribonucleotide synthase [Dokdonella fugitiva]TCO42052.1 5-(carboxyamino)imidazole ribonucleotide synthase [Dokdonella fugitiva]